MHRTLVFAIGAVLLACSVPVAAAGLGTAVELEAARANARAGGPVSASDAELLERHGCLSGTRNDFCRRLEHRDRHVAPRRWRKPRPAH
ncbi:MAG: hypothetical protein ABL908_13470 [Hyphomicrobium sp.]